MATLYSCELCKREGKEFKTPVDEYGAALMKSHLEESHPKESRAQKRS